MITRSLNHRSRLLLLLLIATVLPEAVASQERMNRPTTRRAVPTVRSMPARGNDPLTPEQRLKLFQEIGGVVLDMGALAEPVRLSPRSPVHLDRVFVEGHLVATITGAPGGWAPGNEFWMLSKTHSAKDTSRVAVFVNPRTRTKPILVDCLVHLAGDSPAGATGRLTMRGEGVNQWIMVGTTAMHASVVLPPAGPGSPAEVLRLTTDVSDYGRNFIIRYCDVTALN